MIAVMCKLLGIEKIRTTPYHPQTNGSAKEGTPDTTEDDWQAQSGKTPEVARAHRICADRLQCYTVSGDRLLPVLPYVQAETPVACGPVIPDSEQMRMDPYHRRICEGSYE